MMSLWDALRMNMMISYQELVRTFLRIDNLCSYPQSFLIKNPRNAYPAIHEKLAG